MLFASLLALTAGRAQPAESPEVTRARQELDHARQLVAAGALPVARLHSAEQALEDARDYEVLERTLYGRVEAAQLSEQQAHDMLAAAGRRFDRQQRKLEATRKLVAEGASAPRDFVIQQDELERRRQALELAHERATLFEQIVAMARAEQAAAVAMEQKPPAPTAPDVERFDGDGVFTPKDLRSLTLDWEKKFSRPLPVSARGETSVHRALGFDHRGRVDVVVDPDAPEGIWLRAYLASREIPYYAFRVAVPGKATAPHIHIGPGSVRLRAAD